MKIDFLNVRQVTGYTIGCVDFFNWIKYSLNTL